MHKQETKNVAATEHTSSMKLAESKPILEALEEERARQEGCQLDNLIKQDLATQAGQ